MKKGDLYVVGIVLILSVLIMPITLYFNLYILASLEMLILVILIGIFIGDEIKRLIEEL